MRAGNLRHHVDFLAKQVTRDAMGGEVIEWIEAGSDWVEALPVSGREFFASMQMEEEISVQFNMRYHADLLPQASWRLVWQDQPYDIVRVLDTRGRGRELNLMCRTAPQT